MTVSVAPLSIVSVVSPAVVPVIVKELMVVLAVRVGWFVVVLGIVTAVPGPGALGLLLQLLPVLHVVLVPPVQVAKVGPELR